MRVYERDEMKQIADAMTPKEAEIFSDLLQQIQEARERFKNRISHYGIRDGNELRMAEQIFRKERRLIVLEAKKKLALFGGTGGEEQE